ncbi:Flp pilus assembly protein CpaB [Methylobrevis pamukkalensis]|uniref:SAF domain protein n=1 Tax=Methylobrevis pamukkalensis TaxID=1439726 RepID=A0A1E3H3I5_9HYPH|nr:Flp pilus assembly protein CpaB [Methylobrevis pamukkalensis]ODN70907.1 SAF domain protein [Methylobrevis pamukkalensis]
MRPIQVVILVVALGAAVAAAMLAMNMTGRGDADSAAPVQAVIPSEEVLVVSSDIPMGGTVGAGNLQWRNWPKDGLGEGYVVRAQRPEGLTEISGMIARSQLLAGEPVREARLVRSDRGFLSAVLPKGMRAVAVKVNAASTAGGFILPNDHVDVVLTMQNGGSEGAPATAVSETILSNVRVLAIDQKVDDPEDKKSVVAQDTATLELSPEQSQLMIQAQQMGSISLVLRSIVDSVKSAEDEKIQTGVNVVKFGIQSRVTAAQ